MTADMAFRIRSTSVSVNGGRGRALGRQLAAAAFALICVSSAASAGWVLHVAPDGSDANPGTVERPLASLEGARDALRVRRAAEGALPAGGATVLLRGGEYVLDRTFVLTPEDSGTPESPVTYAAAEGAEARIVSKRAIGGWRRLAPPYPPHLPTAAHGQVWVAEISPGWRFHFLYAGETPLPVAQTTQSYAWKSDWPRLTGAGDPSPRGRRLDFPPGILDGVPANGDAEVSMTTAWWWNIVAPITAVDSQARSALLQTRCAVLYANLLAHDGGFFNLRNALPVLDEPGEWVVDSEAGRVYLWPTVPDPNQVDLFAPVLRQLIRLQGDGEAQGWARLVRHITLRGLTLLFTDRTPEDAFPPEWLTRNAENPDALLFLEGVEDCVIDNNRIAFSGSQGIALNHHARRVVITRNEITMNSSGGIQIAGYGPGAVDRNSHHRIERNHLHRLGLDYMHAGALSIYGSNHCTIEYNHFEHMPYACVSIVGVKARQLADPTLIDTTDAYGSSHAIYQARWDEVRAALPFTGTSHKDLLHSHNNVVRFNLCDHYMERMDDGAALYTWEAGPGTVWEGNVGERRRAGDRLSASIHMDDGTTENRIIGNTFWSPGPQINNNSGNDTNEFRDNEISVEKPGRYDAARAAILEEIRRRGMWRE